jgi:hypothetical protein
MMARRPAVFIILCISMLYACDKKSPTAPAQNGAPTVTVAFQGVSSCTPQPGQTCTLDVLAQATDPDGDPLRYSWSGCASGSAARATCTVDKVGQVTASVQVSDDHGHTVNGSASGEGLSVLNSPPIVRIVFQNAASCTPRPAAPCTVAVVAHASDADGDTLTYRWSGCASGTSADAVCTIDRVGDFNASVAVSDGHDHTVSATITAQGLASTNAPPVVTVSFSGASSCVPMPRTPCSVNAVAQASDPDGDALTYEWSGCASGRSPTAVCVVDRPGQLTASVAVRDSQGNVTTGTASATGVNHGPTVVGSGFPVGVNTIDFLGNIVDPEEGVLCGGSTYCAGASTEGECRIGGLLDCTCLSGFEAQIIRTATTGTCSVTFRAKDSWGEIAATTFAIDLAARKTTSSTSTTPTSVKRPDEH